MKFWSLWDKLGIYIISLIVLIVFAILTPNILTLNNLTNLLIQVSMVAISSAGMTFVITSGGFDLSVGALISVTTGILSVNIPNIGMWPSITLAIVVGIILGIVNGIIITKFKVLTFVATLTTAIIFRGLSLMYTSGKYRTLTDYSEIKMFSRGNIFFIPVPIFMTMVVFILFYLIYKYTAFGMVVRSIGSDRKNARVSGINVDKIIIITFIMTAVTAVLAGIIQTSRLLAGNARFGVGFELEVITATILGSTRISSGTGNLWGTLCASIMLGIIKNGLNLLGVSDSYQQLITGMILIISLLISGKRKSTKKESMVYF